MRNPYEGLPVSAFWKTAVAQRDALDISNLWAPKFRFDHAPIYTAGSCFAQHFGRSLHKANLAWLNAEPGPAGVRPEVLKAYNYGVFSARTANIYTATTLLQWLRYSLREAEPPAEVWEKDGRYFDPMRPTIEPGGFASIDELQEARERTFAAIRKSLTDGCIFVFTMGLTEGWKNKKTGFHYAMCPGTAAGAGTFDAEVHQFVNDGFTDVRVPMVKSIKLIRAANPNNRILLTVSPVPLTATASGDHVLVATIRSKSVLRTVAAALAERFDVVDYFPSYEIITAPPFGGRWFEDNQRSVKSEGVDFVMKTFFDCHRQAFGKHVERDVPARRVLSPPNREDDEVCEEVLLEAFSR